MIYRNQYIVVPKNVPIDSSLNSTFFDDSVIYSHHDLNVSTFRNGATQIALIGYIINPLKPQYSNEDIVAELGSKCLSVEDFLRDIQIFSGRYVLLYKNSSSFIVVGDACHLRQIYFSDIDNNFILTSSPKLFLDTFNFEVQSSREKLESINTPIYLKKESKWYGDESVDNRLSKLLPNHYLDVYTRKRVRIPFYPQDFSSEDQILEYAAQILKNTFLALSDRYTLIQPVTAGWDSRILLAASRNVKEKIGYYVFDLSSGTDPDAWVPKNLSKKLNIKLNIITPGELRGDFVSKFKNEHLYPRILPKTRHIQHHYDSNYQNVININGNCTEIARCYYGHTKRKISFEMLLTFAGYGNKIPYFTEQLKNWYMQAKPYAEENKIPLLDLFYWEQRIGNWHSLWTSEQDIAMEEISPFNNRSLLTALIKVDPKHRMSPNFSFFEKLTQHLWEEVLSEPINPDVNYLKKLFHGHTDVMFIGSKVKSMIKNRGQ